MVWRAFTQGVAVLALFTMGVADGFQVFVVNRCNVDIDLAHVVVGSQDVVKLPVGATVVREVPVGSPSHVFKAGTGAQATCTFDWTPMLQHQHTLTENHTFVCFPAVAEFSAVGGSWFDISIIPTGPKSGVRSAVRTSLKDCPHF